MPTTSRSQSDAVERVARLFKIITLVRSRTRGRPLGRPALAHACECVVWAVEWAAFAATQGVVGGGSSASVDVEFLPPVASYARDHRWPSGLTLTPGEAGTARLTGAAQGLEGLVAELLRWRRYCRVEGGPELRAWRAEEVRAMAALYEAG